MVSKSIFVLKMLAAAAALAIAGCSVLDPGNIQSTLVAGTAEAILAETADAALLATEVAGTLAALEGGGEEPTAGPDSPTLSPTEGLTATPTLMLTEEPTGTPTQTPTITPTPTETKVPPRPTVDQPGVDRTVDFNGDGYSDLAAGAVRRSIEGNGTPGGTGAPVMMRSAVPRPTVTSPGSPAATSPTTSSSTGASSVASATSVACNAKPSTMELSKGGTGCGATIRSASTRPHASASGTFWTPSGRTASSTMRRASSNGVTGSNSRRVGTVTTAPSGNRGSPARSPGGAAAPRAGRGAGCRDRAGRGVGKSLPKWEIEEPRRPRVLTVVFSDPAV